MMNINNFNKLDRPTLAKILQYLTIPELNIMSKISKYILKVILVYRLKERSANQGQLYTFGQNISNIPLTFKFFYDKKVVQATLSVYHSGAITEDGSLYMWGGGEYGVLGDGNTTEHNVSIPTLIDNFSGIKVVQISISSSHSGAITEDGSLYMWGNGIYGKLGDGNTASHVVSIPTLIDSFDGKKVVQISLSVTHSGAITEDGSLYMWGNGQYGVLGDGDTTFHIVSIPTLIDKFNCKKVVQISLGAFYSGAITEDGSLYMWGSSEYGSLGDGNISDYNVGIPLLIDNFGGKKVVHLSLGPYNSGAITEDGSLYMWGNGLYGKLGDGDTTDHNVRVPLIIDNFDGKKVEQISFSRLHSGAITEDGSLYMWGGGEYGVLGDGNTTEHNVSVPTLIYNKVIHICISYNMSIMIIIEPDNSKWLKF